MTEPRTLKVPQRKLQNSEREQLVRSLQERFKNPEARNGLREAGANVRSRLEQMRKDRELDPRTLRKPFTV